MSSTVDETNQRNVDANPGNSKDNTEMFRKLRDHNNVQDESLETSGEISFDSEGDSVLSLDGMPPPPSQQSGLTPVTKSGFSLQNVTVSPLRPMITRETTATSPSTFLNETIQEERQLTPQKTEVSMYPPMRLNAIAGHKMSMHGVSPVKVAHSPFKSMWTSGPSGVTVPSGRPDDTPGSKYVSLLGESPVPFSRYCTQLSPIAGMPSGMSPDLMFQQSPMLTPSIFQRYGTDTGNVAPFPYLAPSPGIFAFPEKSVVTNVLATVDAATVATSSVNVKPGKLHRRLEFSDDRGGDINHNNSNSSNNNNSDNTMTYNNQSDEDDNNDDDNEEEDEYSENGNENSAMNQCNLSNGSNKHAKQDGDSKKCNCKKSKCLKLYCECFAAGIYCDGCNCACCQNTAEHEIERQKAIDDTVARNPLAFKDKVAPTTDGAVAHNKGCHCKKSNCAKNYCECFQAGVPCSSMCKCSGCKNDGTENFDPDCDGDVLTNKKRKDASLAAVEAKVALALTTKPAPLSHISIGLNGLSSSTGVGIDAMTHS